MGILKRLQNHVSIQPNVHVVESACQYFCLNVGNVLEDEGGRLGARVSENVIEPDDVGPSIKCLQDLNFSVLFLDAHGLENFDNTLLVVCHVRPLKDL